MASFTKLSSLRTSEASTSRVNTGLTTCGDPAKPVFLIVSPATEQNGPLWSEVLRRSNAKRVAEAKLGARGAMRASELSPEQMKALRVADRNEDRELYARFVVRGWENVFEDDGKVSPFSEANCLDFLHALPDEKFEELRTYCTEPSNFHQVSAELTAKN